MIIDMYFLELQKPFNEIIAIRDILNSIVYSYKIQYKTGDIDGSKWLEPFQSKLLKLSELITKFEKLVASLEIE
jgi:hypothetical protein